MSADLGVEAAFPILQIEDADACGNFVDYVVSAHPGRGLEFLLAIACDVVGHDFIGGVVGAHADGQACGSFDFEPGSDLRVVGQFRHDRRSVALFGQFLGVEIRLEAEVLPLGNAALPQLVPWCCGRQSMIFWLTPGFVVEVGAHPLRDVGSGIEQHRAFGKSEIRCLRVLTEGGMGQGFPGGITEHHLLAGLHFKQQSGLAAVFVGKAVFAKIPRKERDLIPTDFQVGGEVDEIEVGVLRIGPAFHAAFAHHDLAVDPEPILRVDRDARRRILGDLFQVKRFAPAGPQIAWRALAGHLHADPWSDAKSADDANGRVGLIGELCLPFAIRRPRALSAIFRFEEKLSNSACGIDRAAAGIVGGFDHENVFSRLEKRSEVHGRRLLPVLPLSRDLAIDHELELIVGRNQARGLLDLVALRECELFDKKPFAGRRVGGWIHAIFISPNPLRAFKIQAGGLLRREPVGFPWVIRGRFGTGQAAGECCEQ